LPLNLSRLGINDKKYTNEKSSVYITSNFFNFKYKKTKKQERSLPIFSIKKLLFTTTKGALTVLKLLSIKKKFRTFVNSILEIKLEKKIILSYFEKLETKDKA
jgi:hypothetical protein